ncbi:class III lanthionine synthetase LanKC N-terminal domain-containing protein [Plantactinospora endophytica]|uniref:Protein kinase domain-containing protein n=1 Tax=Plantactinospora endophytica TaxID=673535 RepID=A0ABQ4EA25_9ACTN|nr:lanthionine synthetase LanC family protein [Plantactinospora endophytica]GIG91590.1 hypothetical protein Pen02_65260 [Plantactinospora endophytica]
MTPETSATARRSSGRTAPTRGQAEAPAHRTASAGQREPADLVTDLLDLISLAGWTVRQRAGRTVVAPAMPLARLQGWKLHVSATPSHAPEVLAACVPVLVETGTAFSFVDSTAGLAELNGPRAHRAAAGKFLTAYPASDELFRELAKRLDEATAGHVGPAVLSDQAYRLGGVVHYRYGAFGGVGVLDNDGRHRRCLVDPEGNLVEDRCEPVFRPPAWVELPFDSAPQRPATAVPGPSARPTGSSGLTGRSWSVASMQGMGTSLVDPGSGPVGTVRSAGGGPGGPVGPGGSAAAGGPAGSGEPARPEGAARSGRPAGPDGAAGAGGSVGQGGSVRPEGAAGSGGPGGPVGAVGSTGAAGSTGTWGPVDPAGPAGVLIGGRYAVTGAIRQANKGGVYRARDLRTGVEVLIKEARPYVGADLHDRDVRDLLGHEARVLRHLAPLGVTPRPLREFVQGDHRFLVEEMLPGRPLSADPVDLSAAAPDRPVWHHLLDRLARLLKGVHSVGVVVRDLAPENVLLLPDGELRLVDLESAALRTGGPDDWSYLDIRHSGAAGFVAPEQWRYAPPEAAADLFSLGMLALWLAGRVSPTGAECGRWTPDGAGSGPVSVHAVELARRSGSAPVRSPEEWAGAMLEPSFGGPPVPSALGRAVTGLLRAEPADRIGLDEVIALCAEASGHAPAPRPGPAGGPESGPRPGTAATTGSRPGAGTGADAGTSSAVGASTGPGPESGSGSGPEFGRGPLAELATLPAPVWHELVEELVARLDPTPVPESTVDSASRPGARPRPRVPLDGPRWPARAVHGRIGADPVPGPDPGCGGSARSVAALTRLLVDEPAAGEPGRPVRAVQVLDILLDRLLYSLDRDPHRLPGLTAGCAGAVWALCDAGRLLRRPYLVDRAVELALRLPVRWPDPGLGNGVAGLGTGLLHLWQHTYLPALRDRVTSAAGHLLDTVDPGGAMVWTVDPSFDSVRAGLRSYGLRHGTAGIGAFLLATGRLLGRRDLTAAAVRCAETLLDAARYVDGAAHWPDPYAGTAAQRRSSSADDPAGVGSFLCRAYAHTGDTRYREAAVAAARTVVLGRWAGYRSGAGHTGESASESGSESAGDGEFLLDLARVTGDARYAGWAEAVVVRCWTTGVGLVRLGDPSGGPARPGTPNSDPAGQLAFLLRLRLGGPRLFHPDPEVGSEHAGFGPTPFDQARSVGIDAWRTNAGRSLVPCAGGPVCRC